jgi:hypothetical protein
MLAPCNACLVEFPDLSGTPLGIQQGEPISLGLDPWNQIRPKKYPPPGIPVVPLRQNFWNVRYAIPLGICNSNMRFSQKLHYSIVSGAFLRLF